MKIIDRTASIFFIEFAHLNHPFIFPETPSGNFVGAGAGAFAGSGAGGFSGTGTGVPFAFPVFPTFDFGNLFYNYFNQLQKYNQELAAR